MKPDRKSVIMNLLRDGRLDEARQNCHALAADRPDDAEVWFMLGSLYGSAGDFRTASEYLEKSAALQGDVPATHYNLGLAWLHTGMPDKAVACFEQALRLEPDAPAYRLELANALQLAGDTDRAIDIYRHILQLLPGNAAVLRNLAAALTKAGNTDAVIAIYQDLSRQQGAGVEDLFQLGNACRCAARLPEAEAAYRAALQLDPSLTGVLTNLGVTLMELDRHSEAEQYFRRSLELEPRQPDAYTNLARCLQEQRDTRSALALLQQGLALYPDKPGLHWDHSLAMLKLGDFANGWDEYEWRMQGSDVEYRTLPLPVWQGEDIGQQTLLVLAEQGIGDEIMFASCIPDLAARAGTLMLECNPRLAPLFERSFPGCNCIDHKVTSTDLQGVNVYIHAGSVPRQLRRTPQDFPARAAYLQAAPDNTDRWKARYRELDGPISVGVSWKGGHKSRSRVRSSRLEDWLPLLRTPGASFVNLQYGETRAELAQLRTAHGMTLHHWEDADPLRDMDDFAAQISALDLIISVDNSTVHLAGALGIETWLLQPYSTDWRWQEVTERSYWYPSIRQFHQTGPGNWTDVIATVRARLADRVSHASGNRS